MSVDGCIRLIIREALEESHRIDLLELCRKAAKREATLQRKKTMTKDPTKGQGVLLRTANFQEPTIFAQVSLVQPSDPTVGQVDLDIDLTSDLPTGSESTETAAHTDELAHAVDAEEPATMQKFRTQQIQPVSKGTYPFTNSGYIDTQIFRRNARGRGNNTCSQRLVICWIFYEKGHIVTHFPLGYVT